MERNHTVTGATTRPMNTTPEAAYEGDAVLMARLVQGEEQALSTLYDRYARLIYAIAFRISGDQNSAEEVTQDVFQAIWQSAASFQSDANLASWIMGIARHRAIDTTRSRRFRARQRETELPEDQPSADSGADESTDRLLLREVMKEALTSLPSAQRQPLTLAFYGGLTHHEIALQLGEPIGTIKSRMRLGLLKLRSSLGHLREA
jgi:RNA polymerase sigma-70 factor, ECF subfamily